MLTREKAKSAVDGLAIECYDMYSMATHTESIIDQIYDEHEAQMKTLDDKYAEAVNLYESAVMEFHEKLKAKDEEIERLKTERDHFYNKYIQVGEHIGEWIKGTKARSIVAMLFWEWKKRKRLYIANGHRSSNAGWGLYEQANLMEIMFKNTYKMLKDNA